MYFVSILLCYYCLMSENQQHLLFSDGSSLGNPGPGGWGSVIVISQARVAELGGHEKHTTNNRMELVAVIEGLTRLKQEHGDVTIFTDSTYVRKGATEWVHGWMKRDWKTMGKTDVENQDLWKELVKLLEHRHKVGKVSWTHVPGHSGVAGNERCDIIATGYASGDEPGLFEGELGDYAIDILNISIDEKMAEARSKSKSRSREKAYSYLSLVDGKAMRHTTWPECERRVKGKSNTKYKKAISPSDEHAILQSWGVQL
jgi:ribonuclease HI